MADCDISIDGFQREVGDLDVSEKYIQLMLDTMSEDAIYTRAKETLYHQFDDLQLTEKEKAGFVVEFISTMTNELSKSSMVTALSWAKEERDGPYTLAKVKADTEIALANYEKVKEEICLLRKDNELKCIQIEATGAQSIRENGRVESYKVNPDGNISCHPLTLEDEGLKYFQIRQVEADSYRIFADAYRKSGVVELGLDTSDSVYKGLTGTTHSAVGEVAGYTTQQSANAERQRIAYEDSKANHAANASSSMIGQMLSAEVAPITEDVQRWRNAVDRLLSKHSSTNS